MSRARDIANLQSSKITADAGIDIDNINIDGTEIDLSSGDLTLDVAGDIHLDAGGSDIRLEVAGTQFGKFTRSSGDFIISSSENDKDMKFAGADGGADITALTLDMSEAGAATFNSGITVGGTLNLNSQQISNGSTIGATKGVFTSSATGQLTLNSTSSDYMLEFQRSGTSEWWLKASSSAFHIHENGGSDYLTVKSGGNVGIGTTSPNSPLEVSDGVENYRIDFGTNEVYLMARNASAYIEAEYIAESHEFRGYGNDSGNLAMKIDTNANVSIGGGDPVPSDSQYNTATLHLRQAGNASSTNKGTQIKFTTGSSGHTASDGGFIAYWHDNNFYFNNQEGGQFRFYTGGLEAVNIAGTGKNISNANVNDVMLLSQNAHSSSPYGHQVAFTAASPDNNVNNFFIGSDNTTSRIIIYSDGDIDNHDNSYGATSDERIKQDIVDANSQWDDIKAIKVRNFKKKDDVDQYGDKAWSHIGVIAQELETVSPKLIKERQPTATDIKHSSEFGTLYEDGDTIPDDKEIGDVKEIKENVKRVNYSVLYMKAVKALQEAMTRIETLEAKVAKLEGE